jgi:hypothetical protein
MTIRAVVIAAMLAVPAVAEPPVHCDRLPQWDAQRDGDYRYGDRVWARVQLAVEPHAYECRWHLPDEVRPRHARSISALEESRRVRKVSIAARHRGRSARAVDQFAMQIFRQWIRA